MSKSGNIFQLNRSLFSEIALMYEQISFSWKYCKNWNIYSAVDALHKRRYQIYRLLNVSKLQSFNADSIYIASIQRLSGENGTLCFRRLGVQRVSACTGAKRSFQFRVLSTVEGTESLVWRGRLYLCSLLLYWGFWYRCPVASVILQRSHTKLKNRDQLILITVRSQRSRSHT